MAEAPVRPDGVPPGARFNAELEAFELESKDELGRRSGEYRAFRADDGTLDWSCTYREGLRDGPFTRFHPNGQTAQRGSYARGTLHGEVVAYASDGPTTLPLQPCCVPSGAWELRSRYHDGRLIRQVFYDREGHPIGRSGARWPARPANVHPDAEYDEESELWLLRTELARGGMLLRRHAADGVPLNETEYRAGNEVCERRLDAAGFPTDEYHFDEEGRYHGPCSRWFSESVTPYADARIREERGQFWRGQPVGSFTWLDGEGEVVTRRELGAGLTDAMLASSTVFAAELESESVETLWTLSETLRQQGRVREGIIAAARAAAREQNAARLSRWLEHVRLAVLPEIASALGDALLTRASVAPNDALSALLLGTDAATSLRALAGVLSHVPRAALEVAEAAVLLAPNRLGPLMTRALLRLELGRTTLVLADAAMLESASPEVSAHLRDSVRLFFPEFTFWPSRETLEPLPPGSPSFDVAQPLERVRRQLAVYATRLERLRARAHALLGEAGPWVWPDTGALLPNGPIELERSTAFVEDETEDGVERTEVTVDEALGLDVRSVEEIASAARATWSAVCWLCWGVGLDRVVVPNAIAPRADLAAAVNMAIVRHGRVKDQVQTGGLVSRARGVPDFTWEGSNVTELDQRFVALAAAEYSELRALFFWLIFEANLSPFQSDVRAA